MALISLAHKHTTLTRIISIHLSDCWTFAVHHKRTHYLSISRCESKWAILVGTNKATLSFWSFAPFHNYLCIHLPIFFSRCFFPYRPNVVSRFSSSALFIVSMCMCMRMRMYLSLFVYTLYATWRRARVCNFENESNCSIKYRNESTSQMGSNWSCQLFIWTSESLSKSSANIQIE